VFTKGFSLIKNENKMKITLVKTRNDRSLVMVVVAAVAAAVAVVVRPQTPGLERRRTSLQSIRYL